MPFKSKAQIRKFHALVADGMMSKNVLDEWMTATKNPHKLPERIKPKKKKKKSKLSKLAALASHIAEVAGLGALAVPSIHNSISKKPMGEKASRAFELGGLGVLAAPSIAHIAKSVITKHAGAWMDVGAHAGSAIGGMLGEKTLEAVGNSPMPMDAIKAFAKKINVDSKIMNVDSKEFMLSDFDPKIPSLPKTMKEVYEKYEIAPKGSLDFRSRVARNGYHGKLLSNLKGEKIVSHAEDMFAPKTLSALYKMKPGMFGATTNKVLGVAGLLASIPVAVGSYSKDKTIKNTALGIGTAGIAASAANGAFDAYKINSIAKSVGGKLSGSGKAYLGLKPALLAALAVYSASQMDFSKKEDKK